VRIKVNALLEFSSLPQIGFAHHFYAENHSSIYGKKEKSFEVVYVKSGRITGELYGQCFVAEQGSIFILFRHLPIRILSSGAHCTVQLSMEYTFDLLEEGCPVPEEFPGIVVPFVIPPCSDNEVIKKDLYAIVSQMGISRKTNQMGASLCAMGVLEKINRLGRSNLSGAQQSGSILSYRVKKYIASHMDREVSLAELAAEMDKTPNYLNAVFKETNGITLHQYMSREKVRIIAELMENKGLPFKTACENVAVTDVSYGYRLFKKHTGLTPGEYLSGGRYQREGFGKSALTEVWENGIIRSSK